MSNDEASLPLPCPQLPSQHQHQHSPAIVPDPALERRLAALEASKKEQEATLRRVLTLLIEWVENGNSESSNRTHAA